jgi:pimeloyl-ACP methyl ester carboxylesterase
MQAPWPVPADLKVIDIDGYPLTYSERGDGAPLVLVHGSLSDCRVWQGVSGPLAARYRVLAPSLRHFYPEPWKGQGGTFSVAQHAADLAQLAKTLGLGKVHWLGWSRGGLIIVEIAKHHPELVRTLIFEDGAINLPIEETAESREAIDFTRRLLRELRENIGKGDLVHAAEVFCDTLNGKGYWSGLTDATRTAILDNVYTALGDVERQVTAHEEVSRFDMPILLLTGDRSPKHYAFYYQEMRKCRAFADTVIIPNSRHAMHLDNPAGFLSVVLAFLDAH